MSPRLRLRPPLSRSQAAAAAPKTVVLRTALRTARSPTYLCCSLPFVKPRLAGLSPGGGRRAAFRRAASTAAVPSAPVVSPAQARANLEAALDELQKHAGVLTNLPRLQLAIRGLQQEPGHESIRIAVLGLGGGSGSAGQTAKELLRLILADPLKDAEAWEAHLAAHDASQPLIVRVRGGGGGTLTQTQNSSVVKLAKDGDAAELVVSSAPLNGNNIEFLLMESSLAIPTAPKGFEGETENFEETVLVPTVNIPVSQDGRYTSVATPVHQALIVTDGILGAAAVATMPLIENKDEILAAVRLRNNNTDDMAGCSFTTYDAAASTKAIELFRESVSNASAYETLWRQSGMPVVVSWLRAGASNRADGSTKLPVRRLVASVLRNALANIQDAEAKQISGTAAAVRPGRGEQQLLAGSFAGLNVALAGWAERAHAELQEQLDLAFSSRRWRKLGWWKLFWRADDVTMLSSSLIAQHFLPGSEQGIVHLAGRIEEAARLSQPASTTTQLTTDELAAPLVLYAAPTVLSSTGTSADNELRPLQPSPKTRWPTHISFTRRYLLDETVPALQALAQKLVLQTASTSGLTTALAVLTYLSSLGTYEAGAVAALGLVWSLGRMQRKWETARDFWEGEVREEGRKAVRSVEASVAETLNQTRAVATGEQDRGRVLHDLRQARELVRKAEEALQQLR